MTATPLLISVRQTGLGCKVWGSRLTDGLLVLGYPAEVIFGKFLVDVYVYVLTLQTFYLFQIY